MATKKKLQVKPTKSKEVKYTGSASKLYSPGKKLKVTTKSGGMQKGANPMKLSDGFRGSSKVKTTRPGAKKKR